MGKPSHSHAQVPPDRLRCNERSATAAVCAVMDCWGALLDCLPCRKDSHRAGNTCLWKKDFGPEAALCAVKVDPSDARRLCLAGQKGSLIVLRLTGMARDRVEQQTYKVDMSASKPGDALRAVFSLTRDLLYVLLPREASPALMHRINRRTILLLW